MTVDARIGADKARARHRWPGARKPLPSLSGEGNSSAIPLLYGALDLGTNNCRLLIAAPGRNGFDVVDAFSRIVRLGEGLSSTGLLSDQAMRRTIDSLRVCANKLAWRKVRRLRLVATEACRTAGNGGAFLDLVKAETGLQLELIDRETEAGLAATGAEPLIEAGAANALVFDIGGGSTELMWLEQAGEVRRIAAWTSLAAGVVTISERFGGVHVTPEAYEAMRLHLRPMMQGFADEVRRVTRGDGLPVHLLGTSGTVTTIAGVQLGLRRYDRSRVDGCWLEKPAIAEVTARLLAMTYEERTTNPCIGRDRADLVLAGCAILGRDR